MKHIRAEGIFCNINDHGLNIGDYHNCDLLDIVSGNTSSLNSVFEKFTLFTEASKNSLDTGTPFVMMLILIDHTDPANQQFLYQSLVQFKPENFSKGFMVHVTGTDYPSHPVSGYVSFENANLVLDILLTAFLSMCEEYTHYAGQAQTP